VPRRGIGSTTSQHNKAPASPDTWPPIESTKVPDVASERTVNSRNSWRSAAYGYCKAKTSAEGYRSDVAAVTVS
jgi:hypothetical protein